jgi:hypothetical protein
MPDRFYSVVPIAILALVAGMMMAPGGGKGGGKGGKGGPVPAVEFFVDAVIGDDSNDGSQSAPFATLERAQAATQLAVIGQTSDVIVNLEGGVHRRATTFTLTAADSGTNGFNVIYRSAPGEQAIIEGGVELSGWQPSAGSLYEVDVPATVDDFRQFYAASDRQPRARSATASGSASQFLEGLVGSAMRDVAMVVPNDVVGGFAHPEDLELLYVGVRISGHGILKANGDELLRPSWRSHRLQVEQVTPFDAANMRVDITDNALWHASQRGYFATFIVPGDPFYLENARELLDEAGEWFFDPRLRKLYWWPPAGVDPNQVETWIPAVETLLDVDGTPGAPVENVKIQDIVFRHSTYLAPSEHGYVSGQSASWFVGWEFDDWMQDAGASHPYLSSINQQGLAGAAVEMDSAHRVEFTGNVLTELGADGVLLHNDVADVTFSGNVFDDISGSGLVAGHPEHVYLDQPMERLVARVTFSNNLVARVGREYFTGVGVRVYKSADFVIANNDFIDSPYSAVSLGWGHNNFPDSTVHRRNQIVENHFDNVMNTLYDGSAIYLLGPAADVGSPASEGTVVQGNHVDYSTAAIPAKLPGDTVDPSFAKRPGMQLDEGTRNVVINKNVVVDPATVWFQLTAWYSSSGTPGYIESLGLSGENNWSNVAASVPSDLARINLADVKLFDPDRRLPKPLEKLINAAGVQSPGALPSVP